MKKENKKIFLETCNRLFEEGKFEDIVNLTEENVESFLKEEKKQKEFDKKYGPTISVLKKLSIPFIIPIFILRWFFWPQDVESPTKRLTKGLVKLYLFYHFVLRYDFWGYKYFDGNGFFMEFLWVTILIAAFWMFLDGACNVITYRNGGATIFDFRTMFNLEPNLSEGKNEEYDALGDVIRYRESRMNSMTRDKAAGLYARTQGGISMLYGAQGSASRDALKYVNSSLNSKTRESGLKWLEDLGSKN